MPKPGCAPKGKTLKQAGPKIDANGKSCKTDRRPGCKAGKNGNILTQVGSRKMVTTLSLTGPKIYAGCKNGKTDKCDGRVKISKNGKMRSPVGERKW